MALLYEIITLIIHFLLGLTDLFIFVFINPILGLIINGIYITYEMIQSKTICEFFEDIMEFYLGVLCGILVIFL